LGKLYHNAPLTVYLSYINEVAGKRVEDSQGQLGEMLFVLSLRLLFQDSNA